MKNCILVSVRKNKGFGLDGVTFLVGDIPYSYNLSAEGVEMVERLVRNFKVGRAFNICKRFGTLINRDLINE